MFKISHLDSSEKATSNAMSIQRKKTNKTTWFSYLPFSNDSTVVFSKIIQNLFVPALIPNEWILYASIKTQSSAT